MLKVMPPHMQAPRNEVLSVIVGLGKLRFLKYFSSLI